MRKAGAHNDRLWSIILAGGEGERLSPLVVQWLGEHRPKQYCTFVGTRSMLQHTLDRADRLGNPEQKVTVIAWQHEKEAWRHFEGRRTGTVLLQPANLDTAVGIFYALAHIRVRSTEATVVIHPSDHFIWPEDRFLRIVRRAVLATEWLTDRMVLLGAT